MPGDCEQVAKIGSLQVVADLMVAHSRRVVTTGVVGRALQKDSKIKLYVHSAASAPMLGEKRGCVHCAVGHIFFFGPCHEQRTRECVILSSTF